MHSGGNHTRLFEIRSKVNFEDFSIVATSFSRQGYLWRALTSFVAATLTRALYTCHPVKRDFLFYEQPAPASHFAHPEGCAALRIVLVTVPRTSRSCEHFPDGFRTRALTRCVAATLTRALYTCGRQILHMYHMEITVAYIKRARRPTLLTNTHHRACMGEHSAEYVTICRICQPVESRCKATWKREFKLPLREAGLLKSSR